MTRSPSSLMQLAAAGLLVAFSVPVLARPDPAILEAAKNSDLKSVETLLNKEVDVNTTRPDGTTALHWAALRDNLELASLLITSGAKANVVNEYGVTPLYMACTNRSEKMIKVLLDAGADANAALGSGETVLMNCARTGATAAVEALIKAGAKVVAAEASNGQTALMWAAANGHADIVSLLVRNGADIRSRTRPGVATIPGTCRVCDWKVTTGDFTPLLFAARSGDIEAARILLDAGADPNEATTLHGNALVIASAGGHEDLGLYLIERGADVHSADEDGITALHHAVGGGLSLLNGVIYDNVYRIRPLNQYRLAEALLKAGADPDVRIKEEQLLGPDGYPFVMTGATPLFLAATSADIRMMQILIKAGADPRINNEQGITLLMAAAQVVCTGTCAYQAGGNVANKDNIALALTAVQEVMKLGIDVNAVNESGQTAMHIAAFTGADLVVQYLADHGANVNVVSKNGETPWSMASGISPTENIQGRYGTHKSTAALLVKLGATTSYALKDED